MISKEEVKDFSEQGCLDLTDSLTTPSFYIHLNTMLNDLLPFIYRDKSAEDLIKSITTMDSSQNLELNQFLLDSDYGDSNCGEDW